MLVVFGSINVDLVMRARRLPAAGETVLTDNYATLPGGKGANQAVAAARAGADVIMVGAVGTDPFAEPVRRALADAGVDAGPVVTVTDPTGCAVIWLEESGENRILVASGANRQVTADLLPEALLVPAATLMLQGELPMAATTAAIARARGRGAAIQLNLAPVMDLPEAVLTGVDRLILNEGEAAALAARLDIPADTPTALARALAARLGNTVVLTLGGDGVIASGRDGTWRVPAMPVAVVDTTGAGDTFCGALAAAFDQGHPLPTALARASVAGALACTAIGAQSSMPDAAAIDAAMADAPAARPV